MDRTLHIVGSNSSEIIMVRYPRTLLNFCEFDLAYFAENAIAICDDALKEGELDFDRVTDLRNTLKGAHVYIENNIRSTYDKIVLDCWIDYVCRRDNIGTGTLWNRFMPCNTMFEKAVFVRLCDYRYNRAINEWLNLVRVQDYAKNKVSFIFSGDLSSAEEAAARRNYFDLMFSVTAQELGCRVEELGVTKVYSVGRAPSAAFMFPNISKDIVKNLLADFDYSEDYSDTNNYGSLSDQIAMDAFSYMKAGLAAEYASYNISRSEMENSPAKVYMPCGLKSVVDLEIDALLESGGWLARCKRCGRYFVRDDKYTAEYCSLFNPGGKTCLQIYEAEHPQTRISAELDKSFRDITDEMYSRVDVSMTLSEYESWKVYLDALYEKVDSGEIPPEELENFISYSRSLDISRSNPVRVVAKRADRPSKERVVKPFVPKRIDRSELEAQTKPQPAEEDEEELEQPTSPRKSFFTSPSVQQRQQPAPIVRENTQVTRIIRAEDAYAPRSNTFTPFGHPQQQEEKKPLYQRPVTPAFDVHGAEEPKPEPQPEIDMERVSELLGQLMQMENGSAEEKPAAKQTSEETKPAQPVKKQEQPKPQPMEQPKFDLFGDVRYETGDSLETNGNVFDMERDDSAAPVEPPKPKVIRKNAAAISAYGRMSGAPVVTAPQFNAVSQPETEPFKDIGKIFDGVEGVERKDEEPKPAPEAAEVKEEAPAPAIKHPTKRSTKPKTEQPAKREVPEKVTESNAPSGIWTEERNLFPQQNHEELEMLKENKRTKTTKT